MKLLLSAKPELKSPDYGFGFQIDRESNTAGHGGGFPGISSNLDMFMAAGERAGGSGARGAEYTAVILSNYGGIAPAVSHRIRELVSAVRRGQKDADARPAVTASDKAPADAPEKGAKNAPSLDGTWLAVSEKVGGRETGEDFSQHRMIFDGPRFTVKNGERTLMSGTWKVDASAKPATIDLTVTDGGGDEHAGQTAVGVFELAGNKLKWCTAEPGVTERPKGFDTDGTNHMLVEFEREKKN